MANSVDPDQMPHSNLVDTVCKGLSFPILRFIMGSCLLVNCVANELNS